MAPRYTLKIKVPYKKEGGRAGRVSDGSTTSYETFSFYPTKGEIPKMGEILSNPLAIKSLRKDYKEKIGLFEESFLEYLKKDCEVYEIKHNYKPKGKGLESSVVVFARVNEH